MRTLRLACIFLLIVTVPLSAQIEWVFPAETGWNTLSENQELTFKVKTTASSTSFFSIEGDQSLGIQFDSAGNFKWKPSYDLVDRVSKSRDFTILFKATNSDGQRISKAVTFYVNHVNRPPIVDELPVFYVKQGIINTYQISSDYAYDPDGDPLVFKPIASFMPEESHLSSQGNFTWKPSRGQFSQLKTSLMVVEFIVQDQPEKAETKGKLKIAQTQQDLPPELLLVPGDTLFTIKEDDILNLKLYVSDPNGDDNIRSTGFVSGDLRIAQNILKENTTLQHEFIWTPGYDFVDESQKSLVVKITFFTLDKSSNRTQRSINIRVNDAENLILKDGLQYQKYKNNLLSAMQLLELLDDNQKKLNEDYKRARKGKKNRSIVNASLGAVTGVSPLALEAEQSQIVSGIGGTTVLTLGTLEATEVIGRSKEAILEKIKIDIEIRNKVQAVGDEFARKYSLKSSRRSAEFEKDIDKLRTALNDQRLVLLELDARDKRMPKDEIKALKKTFIDFSEE